MKKPRKRQRNTKYVDPGVTPLGPPRIIGEGTSAKIGKETRQQRRKRLRDQKY